MNTDHAPQLAEHEVEELLARAQRRTDEARFRSADIALSRVFRHSRRLEPQFRVRTLLTSGLLRHERGIPAEALKHIQDAIAVASKNARELLPRALSALGFITRCTSTEMISRSFRLHSTAAELAESGSLSHAAHADLLVLGVLAYEAARRPAEAEGNLEAARDLLGSDDRDRLVHAGFIEARRWYVQGQFERAGDAFEKIVDMEGGNPSLRSSACVWWARCDLALGYNEAGAMRLQDWWREKGPARRHGLVLAHARTLRAVSRDWDEGPRKSLAHWLGQRHRRLTHSAPRRTVEDGLDAMSDQYGCMYEATPARSFPA